MNTTFPQQLWLVPPFLALAACGGGGSGDPAIAAQSGNETVLAAVIYERPRPTLPIPVPITGVTLDSIANLSASITSLKSISKVPTTRIVFDEFVAASNYVNALKQIRNVSYVMGEILDSSAVKDYSVQAYLNRTTEYLDAMGNQVDIWEVGNEINGEWLGNNADVVSKMSGAYDLVKARGKTTELTLYYNQGCYSKASHEMFTWAQNNVPARMKNGLNYVLVSYYEDDCNGLQPDWPTVFARLHTMFPNSKIGFGECGTRIASKKAAYIKRYYSKKISVPNYVGGYFWWYFKQDMVPNTSPLLDTLNQAINSVPGGVATDTGQPAAAPPANAGANDSANDSAMAPQ